jgi:HPt (histidine-containing phosphotransfer) domain-containing protein
MLGMLLKELPRFKELINAAFAEKNFESMDYHVHKLHGAASFCNAPNLKNAVETLEISIKKKHASDNIHANLLEVNREIDSMLNTNTVGNTH